MAAVVSAGARAMVRDQPVGAHAAQLRAMVRGGEAAVGALLPTSGNRFELVEGTVPFIERLIGDVAAARHQVNFTTYALHPGTHGSPVHRLTEMLKARARDGVRVTAVIDQLGSGLFFPGAKRAARRAFVEDLRAAGVEVAAKPFRFGRGALDDARLAPDHRKIFEIDGHVSYHGGSNLVDEWSHWHDAMMRIEGPASAQAGAVLAARWRDLGGSVPEARIALLEAGLQAPLDDTRHATRLLLNGNRHQRQLTEQFVSAVRDARDRAWVSNPYLGDPEAVRPLVEAARAGRDARLLLSPKATGPQIQDVFTEPLRRAWAHALAKAGGRVSIIDEFSHAKAYVVDDVASIGSFNLDKSSTRRSYENAIWTQEPEAVAAVEQLFLRQQRRGLQATDDVVDGWRGIARWRERLGLGY